MKDAKSMLNIAKAIAEEAHKGQYDKGGVEYINHPVYVADQLKDVNAKIVALLHDVVEDTGFTLEDLETYGFSYKIISAVDAITKRSGEEYDVYIQRVKANELAQIVKIEDIKHNCQLTRLDKVTSKDLDRVEKYRRTLRDLKG